MFPLINVLFMMLFPELLHQFLPSILNVCSIGGQVTPSKKKTQKIMFLFACLFCSPLISLGSFTKIKPIGFFRF